MKPVDYVILGMLLCICASVATGIQSLARLDERLHDLVTNRSHEPMQRLEQDVTREDGSITRVITTRLEGESVADFLARHDEIVSALKGGG